jgi:hypothetical protein
MTKEELIDLVLIQIAKDLDSEDFTAIEELLKSVPTKNLKAYLPEEEA